MSKKEPISGVSLLISLLALVVGIILCFNDSGTIFDIIGYSVSGILMLIGIVKFISYFNGRKDGRSTFSDCMMSLLFLGFGIIIACFPKSISITISLVLGALILFSGINRLILGLAVRSIDEEGSKVFLLVSILMIFLGIIIITQKFFNLLGAFIVIYAISEIVSYVYYTSQNKDYSGVLNKKVPKEVKEKEAKDAVIEED